MKYITKSLLLLACLFLSSCTTAKFMMKNCKNVAQNVYECEELK